MVVFGLYQQFNGAFVFFIKAIMVVIINHDDSIINARMVSYAQQWFAGVILCDFVMHYLQHCPAKNWIGAQLMKI